MDAKYKQYYDRVATYIPAERLYTDDLHCLAWGTDAGFYRRLPQIVVRSKDEDEVSRLLKDASDMHLPVTFRAAGTSLSGQAITDSILIVAGKNFGCGSSREQAPEVIKALGIACIIAKSFARIFYRNALNNGLLLLEQPRLYDEISEGDAVTVTVNRDVEYAGRRYPIASLPENLVEIIRAGGLVKAMRKKNGLE